jgi:ABC-type proline/glycine betaine transport system substrate-binding protein
MADDGSLVRYGVDASKAIAHDVGVPDISVNEVDATVEVWLPTMPRLVEQAVQDPDLDGGVKEGIANRGTDEPSTTGD